MNEVADPGVPDDDPLVIVAKYRAVLGIANHRIRSGRNCIANVRKGFGGS